MAQQDSSQMQDLLQRALDGEIEARQDLLCQIRSYLKLHINCWLGSDLGGQLVDSDLAQNTLVKVDQNWEQFRGQQVRQFLAWAKKIAFHETVDHQRSAQRSVHSVADLDETICTAGPTPSELAQRAEDLLHLSQALEQLSEPRREVVLARFVEGKSFEQISQEMDRSPEALRVLHHRALQQLRELLEDKA